MVSDLDVAVLGCGPAGLLAAEACEAAGLNVSIISNKQKSFISGAQYLHDPIPGVTLSRPDGHLNYVKRGNARGYAAKVYGDANHACSWSEFPEGTLPAWSMLKMYDELWHRFGDRIHDRQIGDESINEIVHEWPLVISSIPLRSICRERDHRFNGAKVYINKLAAEPLPDNTILYDGTTETSWYRCSSIFGEEGTESTVPLPGGASWEGIKPTGHTCDCHPSVIKVGRFGQWKKGVLIHHAYNDAARAAEEYINALQ